MWKEQVKAALPWPRCWKKSHDIIEFETYTLNALKSTIEDSIYKPDTTVFYQIADIIPDLFGDTGTKFCTDVVYYVCLRKSTISTNNFMMGG